MTTPLGSVGHADWNPGFGRDPDRGAAHCVETGNAWGLPVPGQRGAPGGGRGAGAGARPGVKPDANPGVPHAA